MAEQREKMRRMRQVELRRKRNLLVSIFALAPDMVRLGFTVQEIRTKILRNIHIIHNNKAYR